MNILVAKGAGFCFGVRRAAEMTMTEAKSGDNIQTFGPLIHNPEYIRTLQDSGITVVNTPEEIVTNKIITRTHGITKELESKLFAKKLEIIDATCPFVKKVQKLAADHAKRGYEVLILGETNHPEIVSVVSYAPTAHVVNDITDIPEIEKDKNILFISQTTQSTSKFHEISVYLCNKYPNVETVNTICGATENNQNEVQNLSKEVDLMIIVGGKESSNTTRLREVAEKNVTTHHILNETEIQKSWFQGVSTVGIAAGASTPDFSIDAVVRHIERLENEVPK